MNSVSIDEHALRSLRAGHPWIFRNALLTAQATAGEIVAVLDDKGRGLGQGFYSGCSNIAVRMITTHSEAITPDFWAKRLDLALRYRHRVVQKSASCRLVFSESDRLPGLIVDQYGDHLVFQTLCAGMDQCQDLILELLRQRLRPACIVERNDVQARKMEGLELKKGVVYGEMNPALTVEISGIRFQIDPLHGQKTGAFLDQRENWLLAAQYAHGQALDGFCYQGGFALHLAGACERVIAVDSSAPALEIAARNAEGNGIGNIEFRKAKMYDFLRDHRDSPESFDMVCIDPPAFAKSKRDLPQAKRAYREINRRALERLREGGFLATSSCSYHMREDDFAQVIAQAAQLARRNLRFVEKRMQSRDHPVLLAMPESHYLKFFIFQVC